jgi:hypothetical protein
LAKKAFGMVEGNIEYSAGPLGVAKKKKKMTYSLG